MKFRRGCCSSELPAAGQSKRASSVRAFTLVELLVVIGIIALLISVLLPALSSARRQAATVKCEASLRDIGNAFIMYVGDNNGWTPPAKLLGGSYNLYNGSFTAGQTAYWFNFLSKYETKTAMAFAATTGSQVADSQKSIFWGCPAWSAYNYNGPTNPLNVSTQTGYGMNGFPEYTASWPPKGITIGDDDPNLAMPAQWWPYVNTPSYSATTGWSPPASGKWYKFTQYSHPSDRALMGDCLFWFLEARNPLPPPNFAAQFTLSNSQTWASETIDAKTETTFDFYRHGIYPKAIGDEFDRKGGKVAFNVLFCDNHVATLTDKAQAYLVTRMRYPN